MPKPSVALDESVVRRTVPAISGLKMPRRSDAQHRCRDPREGLRREQQQDRRDVARYAAIRTSEAVPVRERARDDRDQVGKRTGTGLDDAELVAE